MSVKIPFMVLFSIILIFEIVAMVMVDATRGLPVISLGNFSEVCLGDDLKLSSYPASEVVEWLIYTDVPTNPSASFNSSSFSWNSTKTGNKLFLQFLL
jgi:hypothetical protein